MTPTLLTLKTDGATSTWGDLVRDLGYAVETVDSTLRIRTRDVTRDTPAIVRRLVEAGALILEVRPELPHLEDVYLALVGPADASPSSRTNDPSAAGPGDGRLRQTVTHPMAERSEAGRS